MALKGLSSVLTQDSCVGTEVGGKQKPGRTRTRSVDVNCKKEYVFTEEAISKSKLCRVKNSKKFTFATNRIENELLLHLQISQTFALSSVKFLNTLPDIFQNEDFFLCFNPPSTRKRRFRATKNTGFLKIPTYPF